MIHPAQRQQGGLGKWRLLPWCGFLFLSGACGMWGREELPFSPDHDEALVTCWPLAAEGQEISAPLRTLTV